MNFRIKFLGTSSAVPTKQRGLSCIVVYYESEIVIFDCGEGAQRAAIIGGLGFNKNCTIFITHMHGDHVVGLLGLVQTMAMNRRERELRVFGPRGIVEFISYNHEILKFGLTFELTAKVVRRGLVYETDKYRILAERSEHSALSYAYIFEEKEKPGRFNPEAARSLGIPEGPLWSDLQSGKKVKSPGTGKMVRPGQVLGKPRKGQRIGISGDTRPSEKLEHFFRECNVLIFDSTYSDRNLFNAKENYHSTSREAATFAKNAKAGQLILTHFSARYRNVSQLVKQAREVFPNTLAAKDQLVYDLSNPSVNQSIR